MVWSPQSAFFWNGKLNCIIATPKPKISYRAYRMQLIFGDICDEDVVLFMLCWVGVGGTGIPCFFSVYFVVVARTTLFCAADGEKLTLHAGKLTQSLCVRIPFNCNFQFSPSTADDNCEMYDPSSFTSCIIIPLLYYYNHFAIARRCQFPSLANRILSVAR